MHDLPKPILGEITALTIATPDLEKSLAFYQKLGFNELFRAEWPFPWIQISDSVLLIMLRKDTKPYLALTYYVKQIDKVVTALEQKGISFTQKPKKADAVKRYLFTSPDGLNISLVGIIEGFSQPPGPGMLQMPQQDYFNPDKYVNKTCGLFGELAHPVTDLAASIAFWELLGFKAISKFTSPYPWAILSDGLSIVGLHQSDHFSYPAITYFAADMKEKIAALKKNGFKNFTADDSSNIRVTTPEEQHVFLFSPGGPGTSTSKEKKRQTEQPVIATERLLLKELTPEFYDELFTTYADGDLIAFLGLANKEELATKRSQWQKGMTTFRLSFKKFLIVKKETGKVIGHCDFHTWYILHDRAEIGYGLNDDADKNKGFMKEALAAVLKYGFQKMKLNRIEAFTSPKNVPSLSLLKGFNFKEEGVLRSHYCKDGEMQDSACLALLQSEYKKLKKRR